MIDKSLCVRMTIVGSRQPIEVNSVGQMARPQERLIALADLIILTADDTVQGSIPSSTYSEWPPRS